MACYTSITSVANNINKFHGVSDFYSGHTPKFDHDKQDIISQLFCRYIKPLLKDVDHPILIQE